jgi:stress-induced morphogen
MDVMGLQLAAHRQFNSTCPSSKYESARDGFDRTGDLIRSSPSLVLNALPLYATVTMPITPAELEAAVRAAIQVTHIEVEDNSGSCGDNYSVLIVSKVSTVAYYAFLRKRSPVVIQGINNNDLIYCRTLKARRRSLGTKWVPHGPSFRLRFILVTRFNPFIVNEVLKTQIAQIHAFTQVCISLVPRFVPHR